MKGSLKVLLVVLIVTTAIFVKVQAQDMNLVDNSKQLFKYIQLFSDSITLISSDYVEPVKVKDLIYGAIKGMMNTLDGYSQFLDPESFKEITEETKGEFGGIGIRIGIRDGVLTVIAPIEDTPAFKAGIKPGDKIVKINSKVTREINLDEAVKTIRGEPGTTVVITVVRENVDEMIDFKVDRAIIKVKSIKDPDILEEGIGYVRIAEFQERTAKDLRMNVAKLKKRGAKDIIIDVRNNPGGLLDAAVDSSDIFLSPAELIVYTEGRNPDKKIEFRAKKEEEFENMKIVVLINRGSASAAEIFAGALKDNKRAILAGVTTFGKGSVQTVIPLREKSALRLTTASYYTPSGKNLRDKGIDPDIKVEDAKSEKEKLVKKEPAEIFETIENPEKQEGLKDLNPLEDQENQSLDKEEKQRSEKLLDPQVQTAVNILKSARILNEYGKTKENI
ncbi:MAG: S41 family peptidase [Candidatus Omnitrophota bacterium]